MLLCEHLAFFQISLRYPHPFLTPLKFILHRDAEKTGVVGGDGAGDAGIQKARQGMFFP